MQTCRDGQHFKVAKRSQIDSMLVLGTYDVVNSDRCVQQTRFGRDKQCEPKKLNSVARLLGICLGGAIFSENPVQDAKSREEG